MLRNLGGSPAFNLTHSQMMKKKSQDHSEDTDNEEDNEVNGGEYSE
jgi:hypothetical protein